jgi:type II secretory pathway component PulK
MALVSALAMLLLFSLLGAAYVRSVQIDFDAANYSTQEARARFLARGGINAAVGALETAVKSGSSLHGQTLTFDLPLYIARQGERTSEPQQVRVRITDESARLNLNHTSLTVMEAAGIDREAGVRLKNGLPLVDLPAAADRQWLASVDGLLTRGFVDGRAFARLDRNIFTVYSVSDPFNPAGYLNINTASPTVLAAVFNLSAAEAETLASARPFSSWQEAVDSTGRDPTTYNVGRFLAIPGSMPPALSLTSRCYRLICEAISSGPGARATGTRIEAVVLFDESGGHRIRYWDESTVASVGDTPVAVEVQQDGDGASEGEETDSEEAKREQSGIPSERRV